MKSAIKIGYKRHLGIFLPVIASVFLFGLTIFFIVLPQMEQVIFNKKKEMIQELSRSVWSILNTYDRQVRMQVLDRETAQARAVKQITLMRYGVDAKDYFWINDLHHRMIVHPYRQDLIGQDISDFRDAHGKFLFQEFVRIANEIGQGYVNYHWQWKDDPQRIEKKLSYVMLFEPWGWIVGTGVYINDIDKEVRNLRGRLVIIGGSTFILLVMLAAYIMLRGLKVEKERLRLEENLRTLATIDPLTGASNRRHFWEQANQELLRHKRYQHPMAVLELDVDKFKSINDTHGHPAGDKVLVKLVEKCAANLRKTDIFGRIGGEEFAIVLVETNTGEAEEVAERIRKSMSRLKIEGDSGLIDFTVSIGISCLKGSDETIDDLLKRADKGLYKAKNNGRDQVVGV